MNSKLNEQGDSVLIDKRIYSIFKRGSKTYFYSTIFFPRNVRRDVFILYSFLRRADDFIDRIPQDTEGFYAFKDRYLESMSGAKTGDVVTDSFAELSRRKNFDNKWSEAFLRSMEMDITISSYKTMKELDEYLFGSSEVVGLFMARILGLPEDSYYYARYLGRAMQYVNFIRDISEDVELGRLYFPQTELEKHDLEGLEYDKIKNNTDDFKAFLRDQISLYRSWQLTAEKGYKYIPYRYLVPIKTAADMYKWAARIISINPMVVYRRKVKPSRGHIVSRVFLNSISLLSPVR